jgi:hypothetical protein
MVKLMGVRLQLVVRNKCDGLINTSKEIPLATHEHVSRYEEDKLRKINMKVINELEVLIT